MNRAYMAERDSWQVRRGWRLVVLAVVWVAAIVPIVVWGWLMIGDRDADQRQRVVFDHEDDNAVGERVSVALSRRRLELQRVEGELAGMSWDRLCRRRG